MCYYVTKRKTRVFYLGVFVSAAGLRLCLLRSGSCGENAKCCLSPWRGEVRGRSRWERIHMSPFCYLNRGSLPHLLLSPPHPPIFHFLVPLPSYFIQQRVEKGRCDGGYFINAALWRQTDHPGPCPCSGCNNGSAHTDQSVSKRSCL